MKGHLGTKGVRVELEAIEANSWSCRNGATWFGLNTRKGESRRELEGQWLGRQKGKKKEKKKREREWSGIEEGQELESSLQVEIKLLGIAFLKAPYLSFFFLYK